MLVWLTVFFSEDETLHLQAREPSEQCARIVPFSQLQGAWAFQFLKHWNLGDFVLLCLGQISYLPGTGMIISVVSCFMLDCCLTCRMTSGFTQWCTVDKYCGYLKRRQNNFNYFCCNFIGPVVCKKKKKSICKPEGIQEILYFIGGHQGDSQDYKVYCLHSHCFSDKLSFIFLQLSTLVVSCRAFMRIDVLNLIYLCFFRELS